MRPSWSTYVALGDAFTEGLGDPDAQNSGHNIGWADRIADSLSLIRSDFLYANLATDGTSLTTITQDQLPRACAMRPELVSLCAGTRELLEGASAADTAGRFASIVEQLDQTRAKIILLTAPTVDRHATSSRIDREIRAYNRYLRLIAKRSGAVLVDLPRVRGLADPRLRTPDGLHFNPAGHDHIAATTLWSLGVEPRRPANPRRARRPPKARLRSRTSPVDLQALQPDRV